MTAQPRVWFPWSCGWTSAPPPSSRHAAGERDFDTEFLDYILAVKVVDSVEEAIAHIARHSTGHSEAIVTRTPPTPSLSTGGQRRCVCQRSTRFTDGGEFGLGCEMGISTQKLHARGPMGLDELCSFIPAQKTGIHRAACVFDRAFPLGPIGVVVGQVGAGSIAQGR